MSESLSASARKVQESLRTMGIDCRVVELPGSTRTAADAGASETGARRAPAPAAAPGSGGRGPPGSGGRGPPAPP